ncbi:MAG: hypothetical protein WBP61_10755 [Nocardioides sp.]
MTKMTAVATARKFLLPVGTVVCAGVLAMVMGVPWTSASEGSSGIRLLADDDQGATLTITKIEPGESVSRSVTIRNSGGLPSRLSFQETGDASPFADGELRLVIDQDDRTLYDGTFAAMSDMAQDVGTIDPGGSSTFTFTVSIPEDAPFANQGEPATAAYTWVTSDPASAAGSWNE